MPEAASADVDLTTNELEVASILEAVSVIDPGRILKDEVASTPEAVSVIELE